MHEESAALGCCDSEDQESCEQGRSADVWDVARVTLNANAAAHRNAVIESPWRPPEK